jgi:hypothetical protein
MLSSITKALTCRHLFLRAWKPAYLVDTGTVDVSIFVAYAASDSARDDIEDVVDYNVMRDALVAIEPHFAQIDCDRIAEHLAGIAGVKLAHVTMRDPDGLSCFDSVATDKTIESRAA